MTLTLSELLNPSREKLLYVLTRWCDELYFFITLYLAQIIDRKLKSLNTQNCGKTNFKYNLSKQAYTEKEVNAQRAMLQTKQKKRLRYTRMFNNGKLAKTCTKC